MSEYPLAMKHPSFTEAVLAKDPEKGLNQKAPPGKPQMWAPVTVHNPEQEAYYRAQGYIGSTEAVPSVSDRYAEYPVMLQHPEHKDAVYDKKEILQCLEPEQFPPKIANNPEDEDRLREQGYVRAGEADGRSFDRAVTAPGMPGSEWPKWINGVLVEDPDAPPPAAPDTFPIWVQPAQGDPRVVKSAAEYQTVMGRPFGGALPVEKEPEIDPDELADFRAWKAAQDAHKESVETAPIAAVADLAALRAQLDASGIPYDKRWGVKRLQNALS